MPDGIGFKEGLRKEKEKLAQMDARHKWDYYCTYYLKGTVIGIIVLICVISFIRSYIKNGREVLMEGYMLNVKGSEELYTLMEDGYFEHREGDEKKQQVYLTKEQTMNLDEDGTLQDTTSYYLEQAIVAEVTGQELDYMFTDRLSFQRLCQMSAFMDLREILTEDQLTDWADCLVYYTDEDGNTAPVALDLTDSDFAAEYEMVSNDGKIYFEILVNSERTEWIQDFLEFTGIAP